MGAPRKLREKELAVMQLDGRNTNLSKTQILCHLPFLSNIIIRRSVKSRERGNTGMGRVLITPPTFGRSSDAIDLLVKAGHKVIKSPYPHPVKENEFVRIIGEIEAAIVGNT